MRGGMAEENRIFGELALQTKEVLACFLEARVHAL